MSFIWILTQLVIFIAAAGGFFSITHLVTTGNTAGSYGFNLQYNQIACK